MKTLIFSSNFSGGLPSVLPFAAAALSAYLKNHKVDVRVCHVERRWKDRQIQNALRDFRPNVVGISALFPEAWTISKFAAAAKQWRQDVPVVVGGIHASLAPEMVIDKPDVDVVCRGEGEDPFLEYLRAVEMGESPDVIPNLWIKRDGEIRRNQTRPYRRNLDSLPYPDRTIIDFQRTIDLSNGVLTTIVGRGCLGECTFCCNGELKRVSSGPWVRNRSVANVIGELVELSGRYRFRHIWFRDDNLSWNRPWLLEFCDAYASELSYPFDCFSRSDTLDVECIRALQRARCSYVFLGLDAGNDHIRNDVLNKQMCSDQLVEVCRMLNRHGMKAIVSNLVGIPYETPDDFEETVRINREIHKRQLVFSPAVGTGPKAMIFAPFPGTPLYKLCEEKGWLRTQSSEYKFFCATVLDMPQFPAKDIERSFRTFRYLVYKNSYPIFAWIYRLHDSRPGEWIMARLPRTSFGVIRSFFSRISAALKIRNASGC